MGERHARGARPGRLSATRHWGVGVARGSMVDTVPTMCNPHLRLYMTTISSPAPDGLHARMGERRMTDSRNRESFSAYYQSKEASTKSRTRKLLSGTRADWEDIHIGAWARFSDKYFEPGFVFEKGLDKYLNTCIYNAAMDFLKQYVTTEQPIGFDEQALTLADTSESVIDQLVSCLDGSAGWADIVDIECDLKDPASWISRDLADAVEALPPQQRAVILLWSWKEPKPTDGEIADELGIKRSTAKTHRTRALAKLRQVLNAHKTKEKEDSK